MNCLQAKFLDFPPIVSLEKGRSPLGPRCKELLWPYFTGSWAIGIMFLSSLKDQSWEVLMPLMRKKEKYSSLTMSGTWAAWPKALNPNP